jgi:hypothetical protein
MNECRKAKIRMRGEKGGYWSRPAVASILYTPQLIKNNNKVPVLVEEDERVLD